MLHNVFRGLCRNRGGVILVAGAIGVLAGVKHLLSRPAAPHGQSPTIPKSDISKSGLSKTLDRFTIRRTQSELGYTYWVLQGYGQYTGFTLFDTWQEAVEEMTRRTVQEPTAAATA